MMIINSLDACSNNFLLPIPLYTWDPKTCAKFHPNPTSCFAVKNT